MGGFAHFWGMRVLVGNFRCPLHTDRSPALEELGLMGSGWQMEPGSPISLCYTFRRGFSCISMGHLSENLLALALTSRPCEHPVEA